MTMRFKPTLWYSSAFWGLINISGGCAMFTGAYQLETVARWQAYTPWNTLGCVILCLFGVFFVFRGVADVFS